METTAIGRILICIASSGLWESMEREPEKVLEALADDDDLVAADQYFGELLQQIQNLNSRAFEGIIYTFNMIATQFIDVGIELIGEVYDEFLAITGMDADELAFSEGVQEIAEKFVGLAASTAVYRDTVQAAWGEKLAERALENNRGVISTLEGEASPGGRSTRPFAQGKLPTGTAVYWLCRKEGDEAGKEIPAWFEFGKWGQLYLNRSNSPGENVALSISGPVDIDEFRSNVGFGGHISGGVASNGSAAPGIRSQAASGAPVGAGGRAAGRGSADAELIHERNTRKIAEISRHADNVRPLIEFRQAGRMLLLTEEGESSFRPDDRFLLLLESSCREKGLQPGRGHFRIARVRGDGKCEVELQGVDENVVEHRFYQAVHKYGCLRFRALSLPASAARAAPALAGAGGPPGGRGAGPGRNAPAGTSAEAQKERVARRPRSPVAVAPSQLLTDNLRALNELQKDVFLARDGSARKNFHEIVCNKITWGVVLSPELMKDDDIWSSLEAAGARAKKWSISLERDRQTHGERVILLVRVSCPVPPNGYSSTAVEIIIDLIRVLNEERGGCQWKMAEEELPPDPQEVERENEKKILGTLKRNTLEADAAKLGGLRKAAREALGYDGKHIVRVDCLQLGKLGSPPDLIAFDTVPEDRLMMIKQVSKGVDRLRYGLEPGSIWLELGDDDDLKVMRVSDGINLGAAIKNLDALKKREGEIIRKTLVRGTVIRMGEKWRKFFPKRNTPDAAENAGQENAGQ
ncbi:hypothetical protein OHV05_37120 (plasmid) [Kitasatospora sp. NBC_00070]|uniref:hypothetical protein n=1 Tax=Kitasatospora sp. NBC_00070 TaxID=2975962 RepID=UPI002F90F1D3